MKNYGKDFTQESEKDNRQSIYRLTSEGRSPEDFQIIQGRCASKGKGPKAGICIMRLRGREKASVAGLLSSIRRQSQKIEMGADWVIPGGSWDEF